MSFLLDFNLLNDGEIQTNTLKTSIQRWTLRTNMTFLPILSKRKIVREFLVQFFTANKIYTFIFCYKNVLRVKINVFFLWCLRNEVLIKLFHFASKTLLYILEMNFQMKNKYVDLVGSEKLYQELSDYLSFTQYR